MKYFCVSLQLKINYIIQAFTNPKDTNAISLVLEYVYLTSDIFHIFISIEKSNAQPWHFLHVLVSVQNCPVTVVCTGKNAEYVFFEF